MYSLNSARKKPTLPSRDEPRTQELAQMLVRAFGYEEAIEKAKISHWDNVADTIRFLAGESYRRY